MDITKDRLRRFITSRHEKAYRKEMDKIKKYLNENIRNSIEINMAGISKELQKITQIEDIYNKFLADNDMEHWSMQSVSRSLRQTASHGSAMVIHEYDKAVHAIREDKPYERFGMKDKIEKAKKDLRPLYNKIYDFHTLKKEMNEVISNARRGKQAYKELVELGVDMRELKDTNTSLPTIQKFSVDPKIMNGEMKQ